LVCVCLASTSAAQDVPAETAETPRVDRRSPDWTWAVMGTGIGLVVVGLGTGLGALLIQLDLDGVCTLTCPTDREGQQQSGRILAITTDVLWMGGAVLGAFGLVTALTLQEDLTPPVAAFCDGSGCVGMAFGRF
jgi:hypothetical protein